MSPLYYVITKKTKIAINFKAYFFLLPSNQKEYKNHYRKDTRRKKKFTGNIKILAKFS